jgi:signal transduction histidine kinase
MAGGISHHLRNSMTALTCFLEEAAAARPGATGAGPLSSDPAFVEQLWALAQRERDRLVHLVESVGQSVAAPTYEIADEIDVADVLQTGCEAATSLLAGRMVEVKPAADLPRLKASARALTRLVQILVTYAARLSRADGALSITAMPAQVTGAPGVTILVNGAGPSWSECDVASCFTPFAFPENDPSDLGLDMMTAFSIAYHHGGDIVVHASGPAGPGFELRLPVNPADVRRPELQDGLMQKLVTGLQASPASGKAA